MTVRTLLPRPDVLFLAPESLTAALGSSLRMSFTVSVTSTCDTALEFLRRVKSAIVVIDLPRSVPNEPVAPADDDARPVVR